MNNNIGIISKVFSPVFEKKLELLEKNTQAHLSLISSSIELTSKVVNTCQNISVKVQRYLDSKKKENYALKPNGNSIGSGMKISISYSRCKTPLRSQLTPSRSVNKFITTTTPLPSTNTIKTTTMKKSQSIGSLLNKTKAKDKVPMRSNTTKQLIPHIKRNSHSNNINEPQSTMSIKTANSNNTTQPNNNSKRPVINLKQTNNSIKINKQNIKAKNLKRYNPSANTGQGKGKSNGIQPMSRTVDEGSFDKIFSLEDAMIYNKEDQLLISPFGDNDLLDCNDHLDNYSYPYSYKFQVKSFNVEEWCEDHLVSMLSYLTKTDIFRLLFVNKSFSNIITQYLLSSLEAELKQYLSLIASIEEDLKDNDKPITASYTQSPIQFTKKTFKAISLLNESVINKLFTDSKVPSNDILLIYSIYFQLINHPLANEADMKKIFWKKCCQYFTIMSNGMTGDLIQKTLTESLVTTNDNMYKLMQLVEGNLNKLTPSYFSKICGTTGLVAFFIQDVLEHLGISNDKAKRVKGYGIYKGIVEVLKGKIEQFKHYAHI